MKYKNNDYVDIQHFIDRAQAGRSVYLADLIAGGLVAVKEFCRLNIDRIFRVKNTKSLFSIE